jgi:hypothetical protein
MSRQIVAYVAQPEAGASDLVAQTVGVSKQLHELQGGVLVVGPLKTDAGNRTTSLAKP